MELLLSFFVRLTPGLLIFALTYMLLPKKQTLLKIIVLIFGFVLMRDTMTPVGLWEFGVSDNILWLRFIDSGLILLVLATLSLLSALFILYLHKSLADKIIWFKTDNKVTPIIRGVLSAFLISVPFMLPYFNIAIEERGRLYPISLMLPLLIFALFGNLLEEVLFRGLLQPHLEETMSPNRAIILSGLFFAMGHTYLATSVTDLGIWVLIFTLYEGLICAFLSQRYGLISATIAHGLAIFIISSGQF